MALMFSYKPYSNWGNNSSRLKVAGYMKTKAEVPIGKLTEAAALPIVQVYYEFVHLKHLYRQGWLMQGIPAERCESVAEHSFGVAVLAMLLAEAFYPDLDRNKLLKMALIHDFGEVYAGDIVPESPLSLQEKHKLEKKSVTQIFERLPNGAAYLAIWAEFEEKKSPEAQFIRELDKLEMALQASVYEHQNEIELIDFFHSAEKEISTAELVAILNNLNALRPQQPGHSI
jgi:putative hydrolases of HD superfamily